MDFRKLITRYNQFGGFKLVRECAKLGVLWPAVKAGVRCLVKRQSFKAIYPEVLKRVEPFLIEKYGSMVLGQARRQSRAQEFKKFNGSRELRHEHPKLIWWCWLQGKEQAPSVIQACYASLYRNLVQEFKGLSDGYEIKVIDAENWKNYIELPEYIEKKWEKKQIPAALFSDLLRLELLIKYGGTWVDSTVLCTGFKGLKVQEFKEYLEADLFLFQYTKQGSIPVSISNWFISACSNNEVLMVLRDILYAYWKDYDCTLDYYIFHLFFSMISKEYPEEILSMPYGQSMNSLMLLHHWEEKFNQKKWDKLVANVSFHKLAFRVNEDVKSNKENYYNRIISEYGRI